MSGPTNNELRLALTRYGTALTLRAAKSKQSSELVTRDKWYRTTLPTLVQSRRLADGAYLTTAELAELMRWKLAVSRFPSLCFATSSRIAQCRR